MFKGSHVGRVLLMFLDGRYLVVKSISRLFCGQVSKRRSKRFYCNNCLKSFPTESGLDRHIVLGCDQTNAEVECDFCIRKKKINCPLHLNLNDISGDRLRYVEKIRAHTFDPERVSSIRAGCEGDVYIPILESGVWVYKYTGEEERGYVDGRGYSCRECVVNESPDCKCSMRESKCDLCRRQGRSFCCLHKVEGSEPARRLEEALRKVRIGSVEIVSKGEIYIPTFIGGLWSFHYVRKINDDS